MKKNLLFALFCLPSLGWMNAQTTLVEETFTYLDGALDTVGIGGTGWNATQGGWQSGNSTAGANRFDVVSEQALFQGGGSATYTEQGRTFETSVTASTTEIVKFSFTLIRPEAQPGRGIGVYLADLGTKRFFIGKQVNDGVGLHTSMASGDSLNFTTSGAIETITATFIYNGVDTTMILADSDEELAPQVYPGAFSFNEVIVAGYNGATLTNGIDDIKVTTQPAPDPWLTAATEVSLTSDGSSASFSIPIANAGAASALGITGVIATGIDAGDVSGITFPASLAALSSGTIDFTFTPTFGSGFYEFDLEVSSNDANAASPFIVTVEFEVIDPVIDVDTTPVDLGSFANNPGPQTSIVTITNAGGGEDLIIDAATFTGSSAFTVGALPGPIAPGGSATLTVTFDPGTQPGTLQGVLSIDSSDYNGTIPTITFTATTAFFGDPIAEYLFGTDTSLDLTSSDPSVGSTASNLMELDTNPPFAEFGLRLIATTQAGLSGVDGNAFGWTRREKPNQLLDLSIDSPTESLSFTVTPVGGVTVDFATHGWLTLDLGSASTIGGTTSYDFTLKVDDGSSPFILQAIPGVALSGSGAAEVPLLFDVRSLGSVSTPVTFTLMPQTVGSGNGVLSQGAGYIDNIVLSGEEIAPLNPTLAVASSFQFIDDGLGNIYEIEIGNTGAAELVITSITTDGSGDASTVTDILFDTPLAPSSAGIADFQFTPTGPGTYTTNLVVTSNDPNSPTIIAVEFTVLDPEIDVVESSLDFGVFAPNPAPQTLTVTVINDGEDADLTVSGTTFSGVGAASYSTSLPGPIAVGESGDIVVTFNPGSAEGSQAAVMTILSNDSAGATPTVSLQAFVEPTRASGVVVARFDFDGPQISGTTVDVDATLQALWTTSNLLDQATGTGALNASNQAGSNRVLASGPTGNYLQLSGNREGDAATPIAAGGNNESTWTLFTVSPQTGGGAVDYTGGSATVDTFANSSLGLTTAEWTLYYSTDGGTSWTSLGSFAGAETTTGLAGPVALTWDLTAIGSQSGPVTFAIDPVNSGANNGNSAQRGVGFDNLEVVANTVTAGSPGFSGWASANGVSGEGDDSDGDGLAALLEYALGLNPNVTDGSPVTFDGTTLSFSKGAEAVANGDVTYTIETSNDLGQLDPWTPVTPGTNNATTISYNLPTGAGKIFARLSVSLN